MSGPKIITAPAKMRAWAAPNYATMEDDGMGRSIAVQNLPSETIDALAEEWLRQLYEKAGSVSPWRCQP